MGLFSKKSNGQDAALKAPTVAESTPTLAPTRAAAALAPRAPQSAAAVPQPAAVRPTVPATPSSTAAAAAGAPGAAAAQAPPLPEDELRNRMLQARNLLATFGEIVSLMMQQPNGKHHSLADLEWMVVPALQSNQYAVAQAQSKTNGFVAPVAFVLWASVSEDVDQRLMANINAPIRLAPAEWTSGNIVWLVEAFGDRAAINSMIGTLREKQWKDRLVKLRSRDNEGKPAIQAITAPQPPAA